ncbi:hypothetical protein PCANC_25972 [Puccinia coronata f. sp. avenae]|uniref:Uncharacterized protein n=1 Tax=Puccinia coronata f. sp. avenae TaxID=200324 RepID=A0A2N5S6E6_9BASI|nr:hypothetical protein PCANC_25972 [Puccinia coronata f. sp. avenae]
MCSLHCYGNETLPICFLKQPAHSYAGCTRLLACFHWLPGLISGSPPCYAHVLSRGPVFLLRTYAHPVRYAFVTHFLAPFTRAQQYLFLAQLHLPGSAVPTAPCQRTRGVAWSVTESPHRVTAGTFDHVTREGQFSIAESPLRSKIALGTSNSSGNCPRPPDAFQGKALGGHLLRVVRTHWSSGACKDALEAALGPLFKRCQDTFVKKGTACINRSNTAARAVLEQPCSTGVRTDTVRPKQEPTGQTDLSDRYRLVLCNRSQELIGQACPTCRQVLWLDSACPTTGRTRLFEHRLNCRV